MHPGAAKARNYRITHSTAESFMEQNGTNGSTAPRGIGRHSFPSMRRIVIKVPLFALHRPTLAHFAREYITNYLYYFLHR